MPSSGLYRQFIGYEGQWYSTLNYRHIGSTAMEFVNTLPSIIPFGRVVARVGVSSINFAQDGSIPAGFSLWVDRFAREDGNVTGIPSKQTAAIVQKGYILLIPETNVTADQTGQQMNFRHSVGGGQFDAVGRVRQSASGITPAGCNPFPAGLIIRPLVNGSAGEVVPFGIDFPLVPAINTAG